MGTLDIGRFTSANVQLDDPRSVRLSSSGERELELSGLITTSGLTVAQVYERAEDLMALRGQTVPVRWSDDDWLDGWYIVESAGAQVVMRVGSNTLMIDWTLSLRRLGTESEIEFETQITGADLANDHTVTGEVIHAAPRTHYGYDTGSTEPTTMTRTGADGAITVYRTVPQSPEWSAAPENFYTGSVQIVRPSDSRVYTGIEHEFDPSDWRIENELVRVSTAVTNGTFLVESYDGTAWRDQEFELVLPGVDEIDTDVSWNAVTAIRNDPEECILRFVLDRQDLSVSSVGKMLCDLTVRRGDRLIRGYVQFHASRILAVRANEASTADQGGWLEDDADDANGNRWVSGSSQTLNTITTSTGEWQQTSTGIDFYFGHEIGSAAPAAGDSGSDLMNQYIGYRALQDRAVRR